MAQITNRTKYAISVCALEYRKFVPSGESADIPDDVCKAWSEKGPAKAILSQGGVAIFYGDVTMPAVSTEDAPKPTHWKTRLAALSSVVDLDKLAEMHAAETTPRVKVAIEARMDELQG